MRYKIGWLAKQFGITPQSLRFYEKEELLDSYTDECSTTRRYYARSYKWLTNLRRFLMLRFTVNQIKELYRMETPEEIKAAYQKKREEITLEIAQLQSVNNALVQRIADIDKVAELQNKYILESSPDMYFLINQSGQELDESEEMMAAVRAWTTELPHVLSASIADTSGQIARKSGLCITKADADALGLPIIPPAFFIPSQTCLHTICILNENTPSERLFDSLEAALEANHVTVCGEAFGQCIVSTVVEHCKKDLRPLGVYYEYWIPVKKI